MSSTLRCCLVLIGTGLVCANVVQAQLVRNIFDNCGCPICQHPSAQCICTAMKPVVETQYRQQQVVTYRDVPQTEYRQEAYWETVPVTTYESVTVDEGMYQTVWVPKLVTKQIPKTIQQKQLAYRTVPYQVTRRVPQVSNQLVPQQHVRYVPQQYQTVLNTPGFTTCLPLTVAVRPPMTTTVPSITLAAPMSPPTNIATMPPITVPPARTARAEPELAAGPVPDPKFMDTPAQNGYEEWTTVELRRRTRTAAQEDPLAGYQIAAPTARTHPRSSQLTGNLSRYFVPAPSAATVWRGRRGVMRR